MMANDQTEDPRLGALAADYLIDARRAPDGTKRWTDAEMDKRLRGMGVRLACARCGAGIDWQYPESTVFAYVQPCEKCRESHNEP